MKTLGDDWMTYRKKHPKTLCVVVYGCIYSETCDIWFTLSPY